MKTLQLALTGLLSLALGSMERRAWAQAYEAPVVLPTGSFAGVEGSPNVGVNDAGQIVALGTDPSGTTVGILWSSPTSTPVALPLGSWNNAEAAAINNAGQIVGTADDAITDFAVFWPSPTSDPVALPSGPYSFPQATGINDAGQIVGTAADSGVVYVLFWASPTSDPIPLATPTQYYSLYPMAGINDAGAIVGGYNTSAYAGVPLFWPSPSSNPLALPSGSFTFGSTAFALGINHSGAIVGYAFDDTGPPWQHAFLWASPTNGVYAGPSELPQPPDPYSGYLLATGINKSGLIVGSHLYGAGPLVWMPVGYTAPGDLSQAFTVTSSSGSTSNVTVTFSAVTSPGVTSVTLSSTTSAAIPDDFKLGSPPLYYDVTTTATYSGPITLCFSWQEGQFPTGQDGQENPNIVTLLHYENGVWKNVTTSVDTFADVVCGLVSSLSPFAVVERVSAPVLSLPGEIAATATSSAGAPVSYAASAVSASLASLPVTCSVPSGSIFPLGTTTVTCVATDENGSTASGTFTVTVRYSWSGFLRPIHVDSSSIFKLGSTVPVKFQLMGGSAAITDAVANLSVAKVSDSIIGTYAELTTNVGADSGEAFRYDATSGQYVFNMSTQGPGWARGTWLLSVDLHDGDAWRTVQISLE